MAYYSGSANDMAAVRSALVAACVAEGWTWNDSTEMLSKGVLFLRLQVVSGYLTLLGRTGAAAGDAPSVVRVGALASTPLTYPLEYNLFVFSDEVFMVVRYSVDYYQWCAFGRSAVAGLPGTGMWVAASLEANAPSGVSITPVVGLATDNSVTPALFWATATTTVRNRTYWVHSDLDAQGWWPAQAAEGVLIGITACVPLIGLLPNVWNSESVLLPIRAYKVRPANKASLVADVEHARYLRIDNLTPGQVITLGEDRWKIFPFYRKNVEARNGGASFISHSGTFGWAIRYEGP